MDKKGNRSVQPSSKGLGTDSKKSQDGTVGRLWPRNGRRREATGGVCSAKNENSRKPIPQRNKALDKRPRPRGYNYSGAVGGKEDTGVEIQEAELGSVFVQGSKKQSLNHLLNFHYAPRETHTNVVKGNYRWSSVHKHRYNKEQFLQANCQFIVKASGDYRAYMNNPDTLVDWNLIEQVNVQVMEFPSCPICLYPPVAAKITRCGHIYCWSCLLHYLALSDTTSRNCPICFDAVHKKDLKSVVAVQHSAFNVNEKITFKLMKRARGSLIAYPIDHDIADEEVLFKMYQADTNDIYSKLLLADKCDALSIVKRERDELETQLALEENAPEKCFYEQALNLLDERQNSLFDDRKEGSDSNVITEFDASTVALGDRSESDSVGESNGNIAVEDLDISQATQTKLSKYFYFYQASDGQHIYLHALNIHMLVDTYGSLELCPRTLLGRIIEKEGGSMTEELRKKLRYLQHLPVTCQFEVAEVQLKEPVVSKETLNHFQEQIEKRRKHRQRRARDEKRREKRITEEENRKMGKFPNANIHIESLHQFPEFTPDGYPGPDVNHERSLSPYPSNQAHDHLMASSLSNKSEGSTVSFAKVCSKPRTISWPGDCNIASTSSSAAAPKSAMRKVSPTESEAENEGYGSVPSFNQSFSDYIALALEKASIKDAENENNAGGRKKKKKNKQTVLFSTSMAFSGK